MLWHKDSGKLEIGKCVASVLAYGNSIAVVNMPSLSVIIPVYNQWSLTAACLRSLADSTQADEVHLLDNASSDATPQEAPALGQALFGPRFHYQRFEINRNFGPASNAGAQQSCSDYLLFLNNDVVLQQGWLEPLLRDFNEFPLLGGSSPLLLYPEKTPLGYPVQHLGVSLSPEMRLSHLHEHTPSQCRLSEKRRFFQAISAACLLMPRRLFEEAHGFDEGYINGFEDVDLCARLGAAGWRFTVNPVSRVFHHTSQTAGRKAHEQHNAALLSQKAWSLLKPDLPRLLRDDGLLRSLSPWLSWQIESGHEAQLDAVAPAWNRERVQKALLREPYWIPGYIRLAEEYWREGEQEQALSIGNFALALSAGPEARLALTKRLAALDRAQALALHLPSLLPPCAGPEAYEAMARERLAQFPKQQAYAERLQHNAEIYQQRQMPYYRELAALLQQKVETDIPDEKLLQYLTGLDSAGRKHDF